MLTLVIGIWLGGAVLTACFEHQEQRFNKRDAGSIWYGILNILGWPLMAISLVLNSHQEDDLYDD